MNSGSPQPSKGNGDDTAVQPEVEKKPGQEKTTPDKTSSALQEEVKQKLEKKVNHLNDMMEPFNSHLKFEIHKETGNIMVQIIDNRNDKVIKEIPPKKLLDIAAAIQEVVGLFVDKRV